VAAPEERFLSTEEVAERLQVDEQTVRRWIKSGKLEAVKPGREWRIPPTAFEALLESYSSPKVQAPLPFEEKLMSLEELKPFLEDEVGSSWLALPEEEWREWWRGVSKEEATKRYRQIRAEWTLLKQEFLATWGKVEAEPRLVPRGQDWGEVYFTLFARGSLGAFADAPKKNESDEEFRLRSSEGRHHKDFTQQHEDAEHIKQALVGTRA